MSDVEQPGKGPPPSGLTSYTCPGELYSIPRGIHLARLAAFYHKCRNCEHRTDAGQALPIAAETTNDCPTRPHGTSLVCDESVRGVYLNELNRTRAIAWGEAFAALLWDEQPMVVQRKADYSAQIIRETTAPTPPQGPTVVVGFDERPSSPDIVTGAVLGLRRMGCPVIDLGQTTLPALAFNLCALNGSAGLYVTGAGCESATTGFELFGRRAMPLSVDRLRHVEQSISTGVGRQSRQIGGHHPRQGQADYEASLDPRFHALRPLRIVCGSSSRLMQRSLDRLFARLPCTLTTVALPARRRNLFDPRDPDLQRVATVVMEGQNHLGMLIDEDGRHVAFVTNRGRLVSPREVARLLVEYTQREQHGAKFVVASSWFGQVDRWLQGRDATTIDGGETAETLVRQLVERQGSLALSADGRVWFAEEYPACDGLLILATVMQALSLSDTDFSDVITRIEHDLAEHE